MTGFLSFIGLGSFVMAMMLLLAFIIVRVLCLYYRYTFKNIKEPAKIFCISILIATITFICEIYRPVTIYEYTQNNYNNNIVKQDWHDITSCIYTYMISENQYNQDKSFYMQQIIHYGLMNIQDKNFLNEFDNIQVPLEIRDSQYSNTLSKIRIELINRNYKYLQNTST